MEQQPLRVVIAEDSALIREGLARVIRDSGGEVLAAMAEGRTNMGVATLLSISEGATEKHISNIFGKLDLPDSENDHRRVLAVLTYLGS